MAEGSQKKRRGPGKPFKPGQSGNPGGMPKGKRISTWMLELGELSNAELKKSKSKLPLFGQIAAARILAAREKRGGERSTEIILERTEGKVVQPIQGDITETRRMILVFPTDKK